MSDQISTPLYKVLVNGASCHGGSMEWPLPTQAEDGTWTPGEWVRVEGALIECQNALHLTDQPAAWYQPGGQCWLAEHRGEMVGELNGTWQSKIGVREARLIRPVAWDEVAVWSEGEHTIKSGVGRAYGNATVTAYGNATVTAYGNATVTAYDNATVTAYDNATVTAYDNATVTAYGNATAISDRWHSESAVVALSQMAAHVDRRGGKLVLRAAEGVR